MLLDSLKPLDSALQNKKNPKSYQNSSGHLTVVIIVTYHQEVSIFKLIFMADSSKCAFLFSANVTDKKLLFL